MNNKEPKDNTYYMPFGMCIGLAIGTAIGSAMGNLGIYMPLGLSLGMCIGALWDKKNRKDDDDNK